MLFEDFLYLSFIGLILAGPGNGICIVLAIIIIIFLTPRDFLENFTKHPMSPEQIRATIAKFFASVL